MLKDHPILFSGPRVRAILDGSKTMTRRVVKWPSWVTDHDDAGYHLSRCPALGLLKDGFVVRQMTCPYGVPGDLLWVREAHSWITLAANEYGRQEIDRLHPDGYPVRMLYRADAEFEGWADQVKWRPSIHMPRWASRLTPRVTDVRVERLKDITEGDAASEGLTKRGHWWDVGADWEGDGVEETATDTFAALWDFDNGNPGHGWDANPWVWVVAFERVAP